MEVNLIEGSMFGGVVELCVPPPVCLWCGRIIFEFLFDPKAEILGVTSASETVLWYDNDGDAAAE